MKLLHSKLVVPMALLSAGLLAVSVAVAPARAAELSEAEKAWEEFQAASRTPKMPKEWRTKEEQAEYSKKVRKTLATAADKAKEFYAKYPDDPNAPRAKRKEYEFLNRAVAMGETAKAARLQELEKDRLADPKLPESERFEIRSQQVNRTAMAKQPDIPAVLAEIEKGARELIKEFPNQPEAYEMLFMVAQQGDPDKGRKIAEELLKEPKSGQEVKERAAGLVKKYEIIGKPLDIQFEAVDGRKVSLADLKGKVVLIDFWATWCGPCVAELPNVLKAYESLHPKGFEIVGISFDQDKAALTKFVEEKKMPWPQYYDGKRWGNKYGKEYGISGIPTMWLVDKKGNLVDLSARGGLEDKVKKLLAE